MFFAENKNNGKRGEFMRIWKNNLEKAGTLDACCWTFGKNREKVDGSSSFSRLQWHLGGSGGAFSDTPRKSMDQE